MGQRASRALAFRRIADLLIRAGGSTDPQLRIEALATLERLRPQVDPAVRRETLAQAARRRQRQGMLRVLLDIVEQEGVGGLYAGCAAQIFTAVTKSGILLTTKEQLAAFAMRLVLMLQRGRRQRLAA